MQTNAVYNNMQKHLICFEEKPLIRKLLEITNITKIVKYKIG